MTIAAAALPGRRPTGPTYRKFAIACSMTKPQTGALQTGALSRHYGDDAANGRARCAETFRKKIGPSHDKTGAVGLAGNTGLSDSTPPRCRMRLTRAELLKRKDRHG